VVELHDAFALPDGFRARRRSRVAIDNDDLMPPASQCRREKQPGRARPDDNSSHTGSLI
jgi:hypothetical protein